MKAHYTTIHGHKTYYDDDGKHAVSHLKYDLQHDEAEIFFEHAKRHRSDGAQFEDEHERNYTLKYENGAYSIERR